ncbi:MAG: hypothetical protein ABIJ17_02445 [Patescibacteria group bacterium]
MIKETISNEIFKKIKVSKDKKYIIECDFFKLMETIIEEIGEKEFINKTEKYINILENFDQKKIIKFLESKGYRIIKDESPEKTITVKSKSLA